MKSKIDTVTKVVIARCDKGEDLYTCLTELVRAHGVRSGHFQVMGALGRAKVGIFENMKYTWVEHLGALEISACIGNVSMKEGNPLVHCHAVFTDHHGKVVAGHVAEGCEVDPTAEIHLTVHEGSIERALDDSTGLWMLKL